MPDVNRRHGWPTGASDKWGYPDSRSKTLKSRASISGWVAGAGLSGANEAPGFHSCVAPTPATRKTKADEPPIYRVHPWPTHSEKAGIISHARSQTTIAVENTTLEKNFDFRNRAKDSPGVRWRSGCPGMTNQYDRSRRIRIESFRSSLNSVHATIP